MGTLLAIFCERRKEFFPCAWKQQISTESVRRVRASRYRYCLGDDYFYVPRSGVDEDKRGRLCWVRDREYYNLDALNEAYAAGELVWADVRIGNAYTKRHREMEGKFVEVEAFVSQELFKAISENPEALMSVSKADFEGLCAEVFSRRGFDVDLFRSTKDGGIDFLAINNEDIDPAIFAVQCKLPNQREGRKVRSLGRPVVQQIYGAARAWDLAGAIAISGSTYSPEAADFAANKPSEIFLHDAQDVLSWIQKYRWNEDE